MALSISDPTLVQKLRAQALRLLRRRPELAPFFIEVSGIHPEGTVPFLPIGVFRWFEIDSRAEAKVDNPPAYRFLSSGSTNENRASHLFSAAAARLYAQRSRAGFQQFLSRFNLAVNSPVVSLVPPPLIWPHSSLAAMIAWFAESSGCRLLYADVTDSLDHLRTAVLSTGSSDVVVFGTSLHHVQVAQLCSNFQLQDAFCGKRIILIDTGGTKGRTFAFSQDEMREMAHRVYVQTAGAAELLFMSEYGMCELASQAWSRSSPHDGSFICNPDLHPFALAFDPLARQGTLLASNQTGFLAFLDEVNCDSFGAIITEDVGFTFEASGSKAFFLQGRAPDATIKGCSLNVRDAAILRTGTTEPISGKAIETKKLVVSVPADFSERLCEKLKRRMEWHPAALKDLAKSCDGVFEYCEMIRAKCSQLAQNGAPILGRDISLGIIASANIPITWLHPALLAFALEAREVVVQCPSLRAEDPLSGLVRQQMLSLSAALNEILGESFVRLLGERARLDASRLSHLVVFGSDATIAVFKESYANQPIHLALLGGVLNSIVLNPTVDFPEQIAALCVSWFGRGCLTPAVLYLPTPVDQSWVNEFAERLQYGFTERYKEAGLSVKPLAVHRLLEMQGRIQNATLRPSQCRFIVKDSVVLIDLFGIEMSVVTSLLREGAGPGMVFLLALEQREHLASLVSSWDLSPCIGDSHCGRTWLEWLGLTY